MNIETFENIVKEQIDKCKYTLITKNKEYATEDVFHAFKKAAALEGITKEQALAGMMAKHTVSIYDMIGQEYSLDRWDEKIGDNINYLLILAAMLREG